MTDGPDTKNRFGSLCESTAKKEPRPEAVSRCRCNQAVQSPHEGRNAQVGKSRRTALPAFENPSGRRAVRFGDVEYDSPNVPVH